MPRKPLNPRDPFRPVKRPKLPVTFTLPRQPLYVGSYYRVLVKTTLDMDELDFIVPEGPAGGLVSPSRDKFYQAKRPHLMLCVGYEPGTYRLQAIRRSTGRLVGEGKFEVTALWADEDAGPPLWFTGEVKAYATGAAWGGGPAGPQNASVSPATGTRRLAILLVDTTSQRFTSDATTLQDHRDRWMNETINGVTQGGVTRSVRAFVREASYNTFDISAQVFGPAQLPGAWTDYFNADGSPKGGYYQACFTAGDSLIDYNNFDSLVCVSQQVDATATTPVMRAWPYANGGTFTTAEGNKSYGVISMPNEWGLAGDREIYDTLSHELGHNLGLGDQYNPAVPGRNLGSWEMMDWDDPLPHFSLAHRLMLGWVQAGWVRAFNFAAMAAPVDETVTLHPIELGAPPAGRRAGIEIRLADGWNYYFEYRLGQGSHIGDRALPTDNSVLGTDVVSPPWTPPIARPAILLLNNDVDGDGSVLVNGLNYRETDFTDPAFPTDFRVDVSGINGAKADVRVRYGVNSKPDPSIRPWPAAPDRQWQSPDIEVRNARNAVNPAWFNVPWDGNPNTVVARIKNSGSLDAPQVRANFYVKNYNVGSAPETFLGTDVKNIGAGDTQEFTTTWNVPSEGHYCLIVRIPLYQTPGSPTVVEMTEFNNVAQSNYDRFISRTASPPSREVTSVEVGNPYPVRTRIFLNGGHSNPLYRTYLEHTWLYLDPGETRQVQIMFEYAPDNLNRREDARETKARLKKFVKEPNNVGLMAMIEDPRDYPRHCVQVLGGAQVQVVTGRAVDCRDLKVDGQKVTGNILTVDDGKPVSRGHVLVRTTHSTSGKKGQAPRVQVQRAKFARGFYSAPLPADAETVTVYYIAPAGLADCQTETVKLKRRK